MSFHGHSCGKIADDPRGEELKQGRGKEDRARDFAGVLIDGVEGWRWLEFGRGRDGR